MSLYQGISTNYNNVRVEDVINDKTKIDSNLDVLGATCSLAQMALIKTELNGTIHHPIHMYEYYTASF
jgi:hypothetical protein